MNRYFLLIFFTTLGVFSFSQEQPKHQLKFTNRNSIQFDAFGHGLLYSFNYEYIFLNREKFKTGAQIGISYYPPKTGIKSLWIPISFNQLISFNKHHIELGIGHVITNDRIFESHESTYNIKAWQPFGSFKVGYRFQKPTGKYLFKVAFTPFIEYYKDHLNKLNAEFHPSGGLTFGYSF